MNDFDRFLEFELRQMLDPVVSSGPPRRRKRQKGTPRLRIVTASREFTADTIPVAESVVVPVHPALVLR
ncbi:MAG: hypothetical protein M3R21_11300 [Candidatus Dormibacteraeota bacterium]|nr:hypothetical protein [Candidatus Dormibacteraeota bacterium]